ncbi:GGDEF domain-containing protein [Xanthomonas hortorum pv. gardneri]|uniref:GGDEF domain-containing protein n=1 Tax=Xanthomonas hortorum TaxID=56454 RepID=UPI001E47E9EE|nr:GGDEF domain-containing protein [Xanthomonas hortorum]MCC8493884.1 GGDEF domain-containing protein [Xanthomonas hortorum pv. gardneri]MCE4528619.1 GGDEF domain-containing protein [Xanthomonas hortorum pv. vitians]
MIKPELPDNEAERLAALRQYEVLDSPPERAFDDLTMIASTLLVTSEGMALGSLCVFDQSPTHLRDEQRNALQALSRQASYLLELRLAGKRLRQQLHEREWYEQQMAGYYAQMDALNADLVEQTRTDPLTGLPNRRAFAAALAAATEQTRAAGQPLSVALLDVDHFKTVNDVHGHDQGDVVLRELSALLRAHVAGAGTIARYGGEEFVLLLPNVDLLQARVQCEYLRQSLAVMTIALPVTVSIGVATLHPQENVEAVIKRADQALYAAKRGGRDQVVALG